MAEAYSSQVAPNATPLSGATAEEFGAGIGRGIEQAGEIVDEHIHRVKERQRDEEAASAGVDFANSSAAVDQAATDARANAAPGAAGHTEAVAAEFDKQRDAALAKIRDPHTRSAFTARWAEMRANVVGREYGWEASQRVEKLATDADHMFTTLASGQASNPDPVGFDVSQRTIETAIGAMALPADAKVKLIREGQRRVAVGFANAIVDSHPQLLVGDEPKGVKGLLANREFTRYLETSDIDTLRNGAHVEIRRQEAEARRKEDQDKATWREGVSALGKRVTTMADYSVTDAEFDAADAGAKKYGDKSTEIDIANWRDLRDVARETRTWTPTQWSSAVNELEAKGDKRTPAESLRLKHLEDLHGPAVSRFNSDPFAAAAVAGNPAPEVDWSAPDPKAISDRVTWARSYARSAGLVNVPYLSVNELGELRDRARQGPTGQLAVARSVAGAFGVSAATAIVRQIDPNNRDMQIMVGLNDRTADLYGKGVEGLKAGTVKLGADETDNQAIRDAFSEYMGGIPTDLQPAVLNAAKNIVAGMAAEFHNTNPSGDELVTAFRAAVQRAGGRTGVVGDYDAPGGFAEWKGRYAWLPQTMTSNEFIRRISRADDATWIRAAGGGAPYYLGADGKLVKMNDRQIAHFKDYQVETVNPGLYRLVGPDGGHIVDANGRPWQFDVRNLH